jgi:hypothetical protein
MRQDVDTPIRTGRIWLEAAVDSPAGGGPAAIALRVAAEPDGTHDTSRVLRVDFLIMEW